MTKLTKDQAKALVQRAKDAVEDLNDLPAIDAQTVLLVATFLLAIELSRKNIKREAMKAGLLAACIDGDPEFETTIGVVAISKISERLMQCMKIASVSTEIDRRAKV